MEANPDYYLGEMQKIEQVTVLFMDEDVSGGAMAGQVDVDTYGSIISRREDRRL